MKQFFRYFQNQQIAKNDNAVCIVVCKRSSKISVCKFDFTSKQVQCAKAAGAHVHSLREKLRLLVVYFFGWQSWHLSNHVKLFVIFQDLFTC